LIHRPPKVAAVIGTCVAETILASVHVRARQQAGHMDASDLIRALPNTLARSGPSTYGSRKVRARSDGLGCHAAHSPPTPSALAYNLGNFLRTLATPEPIKDWSLTSLKEKLIKIGAKVVSHGRYVVFQMAEVVIPRTLFADILRLIAELRPPPVLSTA
jgi:hypothetical protein